MTLNHIDVSKINFEKLNQLVAYAKNTTKDDNIKNFNFLHIDFNPKRATNTQATNEGRKLLTTRCTDKKVWREFENIKPKILGSIFNTIAGVYNKVCK